ncbi:MAG: hypothetical protein KA500_02690 [Rhodoluna sp.]|nr:hypothetical protein [Rhodoluna sp.]MBP6186592.1 hypothetical protein [Rhodoluna sp.]
MKKIFWFATGIAAGLAVAKQLRENPEAKAALDDAAKRARALGDAFTSGYKEREAELKKPASKTAAKKPAAKASAAKKPAAKKPAAKKPATKPSAK